MRAGVDRDCEWEMMADHAGKAHTLCVSLNSSSYLRLIDFVYRSTREWEMMENHAGLSSSSLLLSSLELSDTTIYES